MPILKNKNKIQVKINILMQNISFKFNRKFRNWQLSWLLFCVVCLPIQLVGQALTLSEQSTISLLTMEPGTDVYAVFGHSAVRVKDPSIRLDLVYNYGTFDFDAPNFYLNFLRGKLNYKLAAQRFDKLPRVYQRDNRSMYEQNFNLSLSDKQAVFDFLHENYQPENRYYQYDFFYDNCATRIRDIFEKVLQKRLVYIPKDSSRQVSFRQLLDEYIAISPWLDFGIDLILGIPADRLADYRQQMFLPDYLMNALQTSNVQIDSLTVDLVDNKEILVQSIATEEDKSWFTPNAVAWFLFCYILFWTAIVQKQWIKNVMDIKTFGLLGIIGLILSFMWWGTDHTATNQNLNLLWANPLYLLLVLPALRTKTTAQTRIWIFGATGLILLGVLLFWKWLPQQLHTAVVPIILLLLVRCLDRIIGSFRFLKLNQAK